MVTTGPLEYLSQHQSCFAHTLQLVIKDALKDADKLKKYPGKGLWHHESCESTIAKDVLHDELRLQPANVKRWHSQVKMVRSILVSDAEKLSQLQAPHLTQFDRSTLQAPQLTQFDRSTLQAPQLTQFDRSTLQAPQLTQFDRSTLQVAKDQLPNLAMVAQCYIAIPAISAPIERLFSVTGKMCEVNLI